jgi:hypothetical protein
MDVEEHNTPNFKKDERNTCRTFGNYIDTCIINQSLSLSLSLSLWLWLWL